MAESQLEAGCVFYRFTADIEDEQYFHLSEMWHDEDALKAHTEGVPFQHFIASLSTVGKLVSSDWFKGDMQATQRPS